ncbi:hypothetical protein ABIC83_003005 [Roseateles asaccharophilus]|uniref:hypothetical protein n=1 Tax=Roseateles asaccharophilus TaxID=582607 RepID=UPI0038358612
MRYATQDPKYAIQDGRLVNAASGEPIPADEPVFIFRAKDPRALEALQAYVNACENTQHVQAVEQRIIDFERFAETHASSMREPDTAPGVKAAFEKKLALLQQGIANQEPDSLARWIPLAKGFLEGVVAMLAAPSLVIRPPAEDDVYLLDSLQHLAESAARDGGGYSESIQAYLTAIPKFNPLRTSEQDEAAYENHGHMVMQLRRLEDHEHLGIQSADSN